MGFFCVDVMTERYRVTMTTNVDVLSPMARARAELTTASKLLVTGLAWLLWAVGWTVARLCRVVAVTVAGVLYAVGWSAGRATRAGRWMWAAVRVGWDDGRQPIGGGH